MNEKYTNIHTGLTSAQVEESRALHGSNELTPPSRDPWWVQLLRKFADPLIVILIAAAVISFIPVIFVEDHSWLESAGILGAVLLATTVGFVNEYRANQEFDILNKVNDVTPVRVIRDGQPLMIPKNELVVGDILSLETGNEVPADGVVLESVSLRINQSSLTGESEPVLKPPAEEEESLPGAYPRNVVLRSTLVSEGHGVVCVTRVGDATEIGKVARSATAESEEKSPLNLQLDSLSKGISVLGSTIAFFIFASLIVMDVVQGNFVLSGPQWGVFSIIILTAAVLMFKIWYPVLMDLAGYAKLHIPAPTLVTKEGAAPWLICFVGGLLVFGIGMGIMIGTGAVAADITTWLPGDAAASLMTYFMIAITLIVVSVPEGLPMSVTLSLAYSMRKMARQNNLVRQMDACETIGAATVVCSDKTGTLTMNRMTVRESHFPGVTEQGAKAPIFPLLTEAVAVNSTADLDADGTVLGNVTEGAMLMFLKDSGVSYSEKRDAFKLIGQLPFHTQNKYMATCGTSSVLEGTNVLYIKGAPEIVLSKCSSTYDGPLTDTVRDSVMQTIVTAQRKAMRVLGLAYRPNCSETEPDAIKAAATDLVWLGCFVIQDPVRPDVPAAIESCHRAGVGVKIVTGDNFETACQIGREIGLLPAEELPEGAVLTGEQFADLTDEQLYNQVDDLRVLSRARPLDKLRLVKTLQKKNHVVAVTGDGTNDAPALNHADVGLSMGITGTSVAKEASDIILLDDSFTSIIRAIKWGRSLYRNIQKFIVFQLTVNVAACGIAALGPFIGCDLPLTVTQMLWVNLIMDTFAALALATEPPSDDVMDKKPRNKLAFIITPDMWKWILSLGAAFIVALIAYVKLGVEGGVTTEHTHEVTMLFTGFVMLQFWNLFNARVYGTNKSFLNGIFGNISFLLIAGVIVLGQVLAVQFGGEILRTEPISLQDWLVIIAVTCPVLIVGEIVRFIGRCREKKA